MGEKTTRLLVSIVLSLSLVGAGLFVLILDTSSTDTEKAAFGWIGLVIGYWLR